MELPLSILFKIILKYSEEQVQTYLGLNKE